MNQSHNTLVVGFDRRAILPHVPRQQFLFIDDGHISIERRAKTFDPAIHSFDPLRDMDHIRAAEFLSVMDAVFPEGAQTLTRRYSNFILFKQLLDKPRRLSDLIISSKDPYQRDASERIERLLLSPLLERVLNRRTNVLSLEGTIVANLDRAKLGDFDAFVIGNLLVSQYHDTVVIPDFGFYAHRAHSKLIREDRLIAGINSFDEVKDLRNQLIQIENKVGSHCTPEDAELLTLYAGILPHTIGYHDQIARLIKPSEG